MSDGLGWLKIFHILGAFAWMAGLFYLPRLMVYHADSEISSAVSEQLKVMERRLLVTIMRPAMVATLALGLWLGASAGWFQNGQWWLYVKLVLVLAMVMVHALLEKHVIDFRRDARIKRSRYFRLLNEVPTTLLIGIIVLVVLKPF